MAELNFNALASPGPRGFYQGFEQGQEKQVASEMNQIKLEELKRDRDEMLQLQEKLKGLGQDPDVGKFLDTLAQTGKPEYVKMAIEGKQKIKDLDAYAKLGAIEPVGAAPAMPTGAPAPAAPALGAPALRMPQAPAPRNMLGTGTFGMEPGAPVAPAMPAPVNAMAPAPAAAAPVNALAQPTAQVAQAQQRIEQLVNFARSNPRMAKQAMDEAKFLQDQLEFASKRAPATPAKIQEYEYAKQRGYTGSFTDFTTLQAPRTTVNVPVSLSTEKKYGEAFGSKMAEADIGKLATAERAPQLAESANRIIDIVSRGDVFTGPAADIKLNIARVLNVAGANNQEKIANTEQLIASTGQSTLDAIKSAGLGTGQGFTDKDLKFLQGIAGGTIGLTPQTLTELATLQHRAASRSAAAWNKRSQEMPKEVLQGTGLSTTPISVPPLATRKSAARPAGVGANWTLERDAAGNTAWVSPDRKSFKEAQ